MFTRYKIANILVIILLIALAARVLLSFKSGIPFVGSIPGILLTAIDIISVPAREPAMFLITVLVGLLAPKIWSERWLPVWFDVLAAVVAGCAAFILMANMGLSNVAKTDAQLQIALCLIAAAGAVTGVFLARKTFGHQVQTGA